VRISRFGHAISISAVALLAACGGSQPPIGAPGAVPQSASRIGIAHTQGRPTQRAVGPSVAVEFAYVPNWGSADVSAFQINATSGALTQVTGSPFGAGTGPSGVAIAPTGFAYVSNPGYYTYSGNSVSAYTINATSGALKKVKRSPFGAGTAPSGVAVDPAGKFAYVANYSSNNVYAYSINATSGALKKVKGSPFKAGHYPYGVAVDPSGKFVYVTNSDVNPSQSSGGSGNISAYTVDATSGALKKVKGSPFAAGSNPYGVAVGPTGKFVYVTNLGSKNVSAFRISATSGALTQVEGSPFEADDRPDAVAIDPSGKFAYVANFGGGDVSAYSVNARSGALTQATGSPFGAGSGPHGVAVDPMGKFVYVTNGYYTDGSYGNVSAYAINAQSGALTQVLGSPFQAGALPYAIATCRVKAGKCIPPPL
jgi:6-phosphogluconolactonase